MLETVKDVLSWRAGESDQDGLLSLHHQNVCRRIAAAQSALTLAGDARAEAMKRTFEGLAPAIVTKLTMSPFMYCAATQIISGAHDHADAFLRLMEDEKALAAGGGVEDEAWSSLAERYLVREGDTCTERRQHMMGDQIVVDFDSPWVRAEEPSSGVQNGAYVAYPEADRSVAVEKLSEAFELLEAGVPLAGRLARNFTRVVKVRYRHDDHCGSEQVPRELGAIRLSNPHRDAVDVLDLADFMLHETTHNYLTCVENITGVFADGASFHYRPVSPWSGRPIPVLSFCHAVYVYYSIFHFCIGLLGKQELSRHHEAALEKAKRCASGFLYHTRMSDYLAHQGSIRNDIVAELDLLQAEIRKTYRSEIA